MKTLWNNTWIWSMFSRIQHSPWGYLCLVTLPLIPHLPFNLSCALLCGKKKLQHIRFSLLFTPCNRLKCALGCALGYSSSRTKEIKSLFGTARKTPCLKPRLAELGFTYWNKVTEQNKNLCPNWTKAKPSRFKHHQIMLLCREPLYQCEDGVRPPPQELYLEANATAEKPMNLCPKTSFLHL